MTSEITGIQTKMYKHECKEHKKLTQMKEELQELVEK